MIHNDVADRVNGGTSVHHHQSEHYQSGAGAFQPSTIDIVSRTRCERWAVALRLIIALVVVGALLVGSLFAGWYVLGPWLWQHLKDDMLEQDSPTIITYAIITQEEDWYLQSLT